MVKLFFLMAQKDSNSKKNKPNITVYMIRSVQTVTASDYNQHKSKGKLISCGRQ